MHLVQQIDPPTTYLNEYKELTSKFDEFEAKELKLKLFKPSAVDSSSQVDQEASNSKFCIRQTPLKSYLRAHLPSQQRTSVQVKKGLSLAWDTDISSLQCDEIVVEIRQISVTATKSHNFVCKTFFSLTL